MNRTVCPKGMVDTCCENYDKCKAQPEHEPVATVTSETENPDVTMSWWHEPALPIGTKLYTTPPQRKPLTKQARQIIHDATGSMRFFAAVEHAITQTEAAHGIKENT